METKLGTSWPEVVKAMSDLFAALGEPVRLEVVRRLLAAGCDLPCHDLYENISKSTATHHFRVLRESGLIDQYTSHGQRMNHLRTAQLEQRVPGLLAAIAATADERRETPTRFRPLAKLR